MFYPAFEEVKLLAKDYNVIPVWMEAYADTETPISLFKRFEDSDYCFLLESIEGGEKWARFSFMGRNPFLIIKSLGKKTYIEERNGCTRIEEGNPIEVIKRLMGNFKGATLPKIPRFNGGAVGFLGYDLIRYYENLPDMPSDDLELPDCHLLLVDELIAFDHLKQKIHIIANLHVDSNLERGYNSTVERIKSIYNEIRLSRYKAEKNYVLRAAAGDRSLKFTANMTRECFCENVRKAKEYIKDGDIFQVVLSQRLRIESGHMPLDVYRALRVINPSPYMYCLKFNDYSLVGSSPEMLARVENGMVETCPIAGTRRRGLTDDEDKLLEKELLSDEKELAEHTMLVDLGRNDIGRVSKFGTVTVNDFMHIERYSHVMHLVTSVRGELNEGRTAFDALMSVFPAGTLSGAPKVRAMEIIDELEKVKRGIYAGAVSYLGFNGNLDSCITIRTIIFKGDSAYIQAGAGIVADSDPESEYMESMNKAKALVRALEEAGELR